MNEESAPNNTVPQDSDAEPMVYAVGKTERGWRFSLPGEFLVAAGVGTTVAAVAPAAAASLHRVRRPRQHRQPHRVGRQRHHRQPHRYRRTRQHRARHRRQMRWLPPAVM